MDADGHLRGRALVAIALAMAAIGWRIGTADRVSTTALGWMPVAPGLLVLWSMARRRWGWAVVTFLATVMLYAGPGLGGLSGITLFATGVGFGSAALAAALMSGSQSNLTMECEMSQQSGSDLTGS